MNGTLPYEVPAEMRDFAERNVEQARKAFDGFIEALRKAIESVEGSAGATQGNVQDFGRKAVAYAENNVTAAFDLAQKLVKSKDLAEAMQHQSDFLKSQMTGWPAP